MKFIPSLMLSRMLFDEHIQTILADSFSQVPYAAATLGMCSEVLGLDDEVSMDHEWGPRVTIFLADGDHTRFAAEMETAFRNHLPETFKGMPMMWRKPGVDVHDTRKTKLYHVRVTPFSRALEFAGGMKAFPLQDLAWLKISEQHLLEFTSGMVYRDDTGDLTKARQLLSSYPDNVLRFLLMKQWDSLGSDWFPIGRIGSREDQLGLRIQAGRVVHHIMRIGYMVSRKYCPYKKWFGTLFKALPIAADLEMLLLELLAEHRWEKMEEKIAEAVAVLLRHQNDLGIASKVTLQIKKVNDGRHHLKPDLWPITQGLSKELRPPLKQLSEREVFWLDERRLILFNDEVGKWSLLLQK